MSNSLESRSPRSGDDAERSLDGSAAKIVSLSGSFSIDDAASSKDASTEAVQPKDEAETPSTPKREIARRFPRETDSATADRSEPSPRLSASAEEPALPTWAARAWQLRPAPTVADAAA
eukprot:CAMPEP_0119273564 /NCGR_PEP_ID=MMETSP1329-20130426/10692_1 /TAXON_ID=114041 /ORGANISM="Genus nov. species nov., Strain RCC1024" /LENGTH=118 /DNA_ID=CAMNT_0007273793 /DNA_START=179 /DNA_END=532 /DNA_ORIENTATION=-